MWLSKELAASGQRQPAAEVARITGDNGAAGRSQYAGLPLCGPWGIAYKPPSYASAVVVESTQGPACVGALAESADLQPGELLLYSSGGASILLCNDGNVVINGRVFPPVTA